MGPAESPTETAKEFVEVLPEEDGEGEELVAEDDFYQVYADEEEPFQAYLDSGLQGSRREARPAQDFSLVRNLFSGFELRVYC